MRINGTDPYNHFLNLIKKELKENEARQRVAINRLKDIYPGNSNLEAGIRDLLSLVEKATLKRMNEPFFELKMIDLAKTDLKKLGNEILTISPCAVMQIGMGGQDVIQKDSLYWFAVPPRDEKAEMRFRVVHSSFDFMMRHIDGEKFITTQSLKEKPCPFYSCCNLEMRAEQPSLCKKTPWKAANWDGWPPETTCWYGTGVRIATAA